MNGLIDSVLKDVDFASNPYFRALKEKTFAKDDFLETQIQFYFAVIFFSRPMAALAAKIPNPELRMEIVRNVWEEHGEGDRQKVHGHTFTALLQRLGNVAGDDIETRTLWPEVRHFNTTLAGACVLDEYLVGCGVMGMIERLFTEISTWVGVGIVDNGWLKRDQMIHYNLHEKLDIKHSQDFFNVLKPAWETSADSRYYIEQGLRLGAASFYGLYEGLYRGRARRWSRTVAGPHSRNY